MRVAARRLPRVTCEELYGVLAEQAATSSARTKYEVRNGQPVFPPPR